MKNICSPLQNLFHHNHNHDHNHNQGMVFVWTIQAGLTFTDLQPKTKFQAHDRHLTKVLISPDTKYVQYPILFPLKISKICDSTYLTSLCHLSRNLATCSADTTIKIWSPTPKAGEDGNVGVGSSDGVYKLDKVLSGHQRWVWDMAYSADSAYLVSGKFGRCPFGASVINSA